MKVLQALNYAEKILSEIEDKEYAKWEALLILSHFLNIPPLQVYLYLEENIPEEEFFKILKERKTRKPLPYIFGYSYFWGRKFYVDEGTLIPRQDTELLISIFSELPSKKELVLELGVGVGNIAITLLLENKDLKVFGIDISDKALNTTKKNAKEYKVEDRLFLIKGDSFFPIKKLPLFDIVISNPPYISLKEWETLEEDVRFFEPKEALVSGEKGTEFQEILLEKSHQYLKKGGFLIFEMGYNQGERIRDLLKTYQWNFRIYKDLRGYERAVLAWKENI